MAVKMGRVPAPTSVERGNRVPSAHRRPSYPLSGCVPAEPDSVSPGGESVTLMPTRNKSNGPERAADARFERCTPEPRWVRFARRCGSVLLADYQLRQFDAVQVAREMSGDCGEQQPDEQQPLDAPGPRRVPFEARHDVARYGGQSHPDFQVASPSSVSDFDGQLV